MNHLHGRVAIVTGGGTGLGRAFALDLAAQGASVIVNNRNRNRVVGADGRGPADHVVAEIEALGGRAIADHGSVEDPDTPDRLVATAMERYGRLDVNGTALIAAAASRAMRAAGNGRIVLVASTAGLHGEPTVSAYAASKGAVIALGRTMAVEGERRGVLTNVLLPYAHTQMTESGMDERYSSAMRPDLVASVATALARPDCLLNGEVIVAGGHGLRATETAKTATMRVDSGTARVAGTEPADA